MNIEDLLVADGNHQRKSYSAAQVIAALDGTASIRTTMPATYATDTISPTVHYTALLDDGSTILTARTASGVTLVQSIYVYEQPSIGLSEFIAVWDEGDVNDYIAEWIVVDS